MARSPTERILAKHIPAQDVYEYTTEDILGLIAKDLGVNASAITIEEDIGHSDHDYDVLVFHKFDVKVTKAG